MDRPPHPPPPRSSGTGRRVGGGNATVVIRGSSDGRRRPVTGQRDAPGEPSTRGRPYRRSARPSAVGGEVLGRDLVEELAELLDLVLLLVRDLDAGRVEHGVRAEDGGVAAQ